MKQTLLILFTFQTLLLNAQIPQILHTNNSGNFTEEGPANCLAYEIIHIIKPSNGKQVILKFTEFNVAPDGYVVVLDGDNVDAPELGVWDNSNPPPSTIISSGNSLLVYYWFNNCQNENDGWVAEYTSSAMPTIKNKLLAYYPFNENAADFSGGAKNGSASNATLTTDKFGNAFNAYNFSGINSLVYLPNNLMPNNSAFAISLWFNIKGDRPVQDVFYGQQLIDFRGQYNFNVCYYESNNATYQKAVGFNAANSSLNSTCVTPNNYIQPNTWYHVVADYGNNTMKLYINGTLIDTKTQTPPNAVCCYNNTIGKDYNMNRNRLWFYGSIDEVIIFKESLTAPEVQALYNSGLSNADITELYGPVTFSYDASGNRTGKNIITLKAGSFISTVRDTVSADAMNGQITQPEIYSESVGESFVRIYPNPTRGELKVEIANFDFSLKSAIYIYNTAGNLITQQSPASDTNIIDLLRQPNGMYIMKIVLGEKTSEWKVIKE
jgi:hypothetical protein